MPLSTSAIEEAFASREEGTKRLLLSILNLNLQHGSNEKAVVNIINRLISTAKHRKEGLEYLNLIISSFSTSVMCENALNWLNYCIIKYPDEVLRELKLRVLGEIIEASHLESDFNKKFTSDYVSKVFDNCITTSHVNIYECRVALKTLIITMKYYPGWFGPQRQKIEKFVLIFLDGNDEESVQSAALAFHYLQQVGSAGSNGVNHKLAFTENFHKLCRTVHMLYDKFLENVSELFRPESSEGETFEFSDDYTQNSQNLLHTNAKRIGNIFKFIEIMVKIKYPVAKETKPKEFLDIISRGTSIHKCITGEGVESLETYQFSLLLMEIQCASLKLLRLFIIWYQSNCLPFSYLVSKIIADSLERSHSCNCYKYDSFYQETAYRALSEWVSVSKSSLHPQFQSQLLECILIDITPIKSQLTLTISEATSGKKSQKAKKKAMASRIISSGQQTPVRGSPNRCEGTNEIKTCQFALTALRSLFESTRLNLKSNLLKDLYTSIFDTLITLQTAIPFHPYENRHCQVKLYEVLVAIYHQSTLPLLPPIHTTLEILNRGANDNDRFIAHVCQRGLIMLETFCQPTCPSLYLGLEKEGEDVEMPELQENIDAEERTRVGSRRGSVDFDASTDEFPNQNESNLHNTSLESESYHIRYTDTDRSTIDDGLSDKGTNNEEVEVEELDLDNTEKTQRYENEMNIYEHPVVTAPSEDGNEILDGHEYREEETGHKSSESIKDMDIAEESEVNAATEDQLQTIETNEGSKITEEDVISVSERAARASSVGSEDKEAGSSAKDCEVSSATQDQPEINEIKEGNENVGSASEQLNSNAEGQDINDKDLHDVSRIAEININEGNNDEEVSTTICQVVSGISSVETASNEGNIDVVGYNSENEDSAGKRHIVEVPDSDEDEVGGSQLDSEGPTAKKAKVGSKIGGDDVDSTDSKEVDPDTNYLQDDGFVDEVKDYY